jgi:hypothetical protein
MFLFFLFLFCLSSFFSIFMYLFIYLFCFYFLFQKDSSPALPLLPCPAPAALPCPCPYPALSVTENSGRVSALAALPCPALFVTTDRQTVKQTPCLLLYLRLHCFGIVIMHFIILRVFVFLKICVHGSSLTWANIYHLDVIFYYTWELCNF